MASRKRQRADSPQAGPRPPTEGKGGPAAPWRPGAKRLEALDQDCLNGVVGFFDRRGLFVVRSLSSRFYRRFTPWAIDGLLGRRAHHDANDPVRLLALPGMTAAAARVLCEVSLPSGSDVRLVAKRVLLLCCRQGAVDLADWFISTFGVSGLQGSDLESEGLLVEACIHGRLPMAKWVEAVFEPHASDDDSRARNALNLMVKRGHTNSAAWFADKYPASLRWGLRPGLDGGSGPEVEGAARSAAALPGPARGIPPEMGRGASLLQAACLYGRTGTAEWLVERCGLTATAVRSRNDLLLWELLCIGELEGACVARGVAWFTGVFGVTPESLRAPTDGARELDCIRRLLTEGTLCVASAAVVLEHLLLSGSRFWAGDLGAHIVSRWPHGGQNEGLPAHSACSASGS